MLPWRREKRQKSENPVPGWNSTQTEQQRRNFSKDHVFVTEANTPLRNNLLRQFYAVCKRAGIEGGHPNGTVDIHAMRVAFITLSIENGASPKAVQEIVGHSTLEMTMNVYCKATDRAWPRSGQRFAVCKGIAARPHYSCAKSAQHAHKPRHAR